MSIILLKTIDKDRLWKSAKLYTGRCSITSLYIYSSRRDVPL